MTTLNKIWVYAETDDSRTRICAGAKALAREVSCLYAGDQPGLESAASQGADVVLYLGGTNAECHIGDYSDTISAAVAVEKPDLILFEKTQNGRLLAGKVSAKQGQCAFSNVTALRVEEGIELEQMVFGGSAIRTVRKEKGTVFALIQPQLFEDKKIKSLASIKNLDFIVPAQRLTCLGAKEKDESKVDLANAKRIVCIGRGVSDEADMAMMHKFADLIGADMACTRPVSEVYGFMESERYVGITGVMFQPELLISIGVSGQIQHTVGCNQSGHIMAVNKDKSARIFPQSDFGLVADYKQVIQKVIEILEA